RLARIITHLPSPPPAPRRQRTHRRRERPMMKTAVQTLFSDRWARHTISEPAFGRMLPMRSMGKFLAAAFITWCGVGFVIDLLLLNYQPLARGFFWPIYSGTLGTAVFAVRIRGRCRLWYVLL